MQVVGPLTVTPGVSFTIHDPTLNGHAVAVQIQNSTQYELTLPSPVSRTVPPNTAVTIDMRAFPGFAITVTPGPIGSPGAGVTLEWLALGDTASMPDGAISGVASISGYARVVAQGITPSSPPPVVITLAPTDRSLIFLLTGGVGLNAVVQSAIGNNTGVDYAQFVAINYSSLPAHMSLLALPAYGAADTQVSVALTAITEYTILATPDEIVQGTIAEPMVVTMRDVDGPYFIASVNAPSGGGNVALLGDPPTGFLNEIAHLTIWQGTAATATNLTIVRGHDTGSQILAQTLLTGQSGPPVVAPSKFTLGEGLDVDNLGTGATSTAAAIYRVVSTTFNPI